MIRAATIALAALAGVSAAAAQDRTINGVIADSSSSKNLADAVFFIARAPVGQATKKDGKFQLAASPQATELLVSRYNYVPRRIPIPADAASPIDLGTIKLRQAKTEEDKRVVDQEGLQLYPQLVGFYTRKATLRQGYFFTPDDLMARGVRQPSDVLRQTQGVRDMCLASQQGAADCGDDSKRGTTYSGFRSGETVCEAAIWLNGGRYTQSLDDLEMSDILALEAYAQPATTPTEFAGGRCGTIVVWRRG